MPSRKVRANFAGKVRMFAAMRRARRPWSTFATGHIGHERRGFGSATRYRFYDLVRASQSVGLGVGDGARPPKEPATEEPTPEQTDTKTPPEMPTDCCMSGCAFCVWDAYVEDLAAFEKDS